MATTVEKLRANVRIIWAIAAKDITDALKNRLIWTTVVMVFLMAAFYKALPVITALSSPPQVVVYDVGGSTLTVYLENSTQVAVRRVSSQHDLERFVAMEGAPALGLVIPAGFDQALTAGEPFPLDGYVQHWVSDSAAEELVAQIEEEIVALTEQAVRINTAGPRIYPPLDSLGPHTWASLAIVVMLTLLGLTLTPQLMVEEKQARTLAALLVSPARSGHAVIGKAIAGVFYCLVGVVVVLAFNAALIVQWGLAILAAVCGALLAVAIGLLLGITVEVAQSLKLWMFVVIVPLFVLPAVASYMAMDLPPAVNGVVRWFPSVGLSRLFITSMTNSAPFAEYGPDIALIWGPTVLVLAVVAWQVRRREQR
jgi:ABC-2 type transport system permease protein